MKVTVKVEKEINVTHLKVKAGVRYWEDATVNGVDDKDGDLIPLRENDYWCPLINLETGKIENWPTGTTADIHYKVCDDGEYWLISEDSKEEIKNLGYYVPSILDLTNDSYGDYIILKVDENGIIGSWPNHHNIDSFLHSDED